MFQKVVPVNKGRHAGKKVKEVKGFDFAAGFHLAYVTMHEFARAASIFPIVFLEDKEKDEFRPVALLGLSAGENLFVGKDGKWQASYVPAIIRRYPFALAPSGTDGQYAVCIDEASSLVSDTEGAALFDEKGEPTKVIENVKRYLGELQQMEGLTREFCKYLQASNMFTPLNMRVREANRVKNISGCYVVNEERLNNLSDEKFLEFRAKRYLPAVYAHLMSLAQTERLVKLHDESHPAPAAAEPATKPAAKAAKKAAASQA
ncbi:SapC family protein [Ramlibacter sp. XY19]|uniref:SapC family protein n=1 Tax=Ramlibacter paludis TaxID=2908000 RepID=UPI0023DB3A28|nr:SapC family protein [Ramlibacter paludis]MCG2593559.1 SapC family protein [Ramlibacter paludis]